MDQVHESGPWTRSMDQVHGPQGGPWTGSTGVVHGPGSMFCIRPENEGLKGILVPRSPLAVCTLRSEYKMKAKDPNMHLFQNEINGSLNQA